MRPMTVPLFLLRCFELGLSMKDLDSLSFGMIADMLTERSNDDYDWPRMATQEDFDRF